MSSLTVLSAVSGTGSAGMEAALCNLIEEEDSVLVCVNGYFSTRMFQIASRYTTRVRRLDRTWGTVFAPEELDRALTEHPAKVVALVGPCRRVKISGRRARPMDAIRAKTAPKSSRMAAGMIHLSEAVRRFLGGRTFSSSRSMSRSQ